MRNKHEKIKILPEAGILIDKILVKFGLLRKKETDRKLDFARSVGKRLDEHRELVEVICEKTNLFQEFWHAMHMATQDDYLMRLFYIRHGRWPSEGPCPYTGEYVRKRPAILGQCRLPEYVKSISLAISQSNSGTVHTAGNNLIKSHRLLRNHQDV